MHGTMNIKFCVFICIKLVLLCDTLSMVTERPIRKTLIVIYAKIYFTDVRLLVFCIIKILSLQVRRRVNTAVYTIRMQDYFLTR